MAVTQRKQPTTGIQTNAEGFQIPIKKSRGPGFDRLSFVLMGILQLVAVGIIAKQLKTFGVLPEDIDPDFRRLLRLIPRNPFFMVPCGHLNSRNIFIESENIVFPDGVGPGALHLQRGLIKHVYRKPEFTSAEITAFARTVDNLGGTVLDAGSLVVSPGVIDVHVHMNEPGRMDWEGIQTGTSAAITGGVTTVVDMPLNSNPTTTSAPLMKLKIRKVWNKGRAHVAMWGGLTHDNAYDHSGLSEMLRLGAVGLKAFMCPSGINDFPPVSQRDIEAALPVLLRHRKPLMLHAELVSSAVEGTCDGTCDAREHSSWSSTRPGQFELDAAHAIIAAMRTVRASNPAVWKNATTWRSTPRLGEVPLGFKVHIAHLGNADALPIYQKAVEEEGLPITVETCAHHLTFSEEDVPQGATQFKCAPPLRDAGNREQLRQATGGAIAIISSDHSPAPPAMKSLDSGSFLDAWGGDYSNSDSVVQERKWSLKHLAEVLSEAPAALIGISNRKGSIREGMDADLVVWDPWAPTNTTAAACKHRHKLSPYIDREMSGSVAFTFVKGAVVYQSKLGVATDNMCGGALLV